MESDKKTIINETQKKFYNKNREKILAYKKQKYLEKKAQQSVAQSPILNIQHASPKPEKNDNIKTIDDVINKLPEKYHKSYLKHIKTLFKILNTENIYKSLNDAKNVIKTIRESDYSQNSKKAYIQAILIMIDNIPLPVMKEQYLDYFNELKLDSDQVAAQKAEQMPTIEFADYKQMIENHYGVSSKEYLLVSMYDEFTMRDDFLLYIVKDICETTVEKDEANSNKNFIIVPEKKNQRCWLLINSYKTNVIYGQLHEKCSKELSNLIRQYISSKMLHYGETLFGSKSLSKFIDDMNYGMGIKGGINFIRHSKASSFNLTNEERVSLAKKMKHSPIVNMKYARKLISQDI